MSLTKRKWWPVARRVVPIVFIVAVAALITWRAQSIDWGKVLEALREYRATTLLAAGAVAVLSYVVYSCYDLVGRRYTGHKVSAAKSMAIAAVSYAFNLNFGTLVGGMGFRYRLYAHAGLKPGVVTGVLAMSVVGNWVGWFCVAGTAFLLRWVPLPQGWKIGEGGLQAIGAALLLLAAGYLALCAFSRKRSFTVRKFELSLPTLRLALVQVGLASLNWLLMACILFVLMRPHLPFTTTAGVLMLSAVASVIVRVPAGLGVVEAVFIALLAGGVGEPRLVAGLLAYRAVYYFAPVLLAIGAYLIIEGRMKVRGGRRRAGTRGLTSR